MRIPVGVIVERHKAKSQWLDFVCRPVSVLAGAPTAAPWTIIESSAELTTYYAGEAVIELHRTETASYQENLSFGAPVLWVVLRPADTEVGFELLMVTADPAEGEALTGAGDDLVGTVPMPESVQQVLAAFIAEHHVERPFIKRKRERSALEAPRRGAAESGDEKRERSAFEAPRRDAAGSEDGKRERPAFEAPRRGAAGSADGKRERSAFEAPRQGAAGSEDRKRERSAFEAPQRDPAGSGDEKREGSAFEAPRRSAPGSEDGKRKQSAFEVPERPAPGSEDHR